MGSGGERCRYVANLVVFLCAPVEWHIKTQTSSCPLQNIWCACVGSFQKCICEQKKEIYVTINLRICIYFNLLDEVFQMRWKDFAAQISLMGMSECSLSTCSHGSSDPFPPSVPQNSMNLPPDKARLLRQYDNEKKWELICDQVSIAPLLPASSARSRCPASCSRSAPPSLSSEEVMATERHPPPTNCIHSYWL